MQIASKKVVFIHYTLKNTDGELLDKSGGDDPLGYLHGAGNIIPGLEVALDGKQAGDRVNVQVAPQDAYGVRDEALVQEVPRDAFEGVDQIEPGMRFQAESDQGPRVITVTSVAAETVTVDGNHPLAGETLVFDVEVERVRDASPEEMEHGHVHAES
jgi:FKBP-type peptidyl-prolyl cis-trans isomerase SlyD